MMVLVTGGPYDGLQIWSQVILKHTTVLVLKASWGTRRFIYLPDLADWQAVLDGQMKIEQSRQVAVHGRSCFAQIARL